MTKGPNALAIDVAARGIDHWLADPERSSAALARTAGGAVQIREQLLGRVRDVSVHSVPSAANRRWACETIRAWAPIAALLSPEPDDLEIHRDLLVEYEFGHLLADAGSVVRVCDQLRVDMERLALEIDVATDLADVFEPRNPNAGAWLRDYRAMSLTLADYLHRCTVDIPAPLPDALAHHYATEIARVQREVRAQCTANPTQLSQRRAAVVSVPSGA